MPDESKQHGKSRRAEAAEEAMPQWRSVAPQEGADDQSASEADAQTPSLDALKKKYKTSGAERRAESASPQADEAGEGVVDDASGLVKLVPKDSTDARNESLSVFVDKGKVIGSQG